VAYAGYGTEVIERAAVTWDDTASGRGPAGTAIRTLEPQVVQDTHTDPRYGLWRDNAIRMGYRSVLGLPLASAATRLGVLCIYASDRNGFGAEDIRLLTALANELAFGIVTLRTRAEHEQGAERLRRGMESTIEALAGTLELRDAYTAGHQRRVAELAAEIAREMGVTEDEVHGIHLAATVHDLGKIQVPAEILTKPTRLTKLEYEFVKTHAQAGYDLLKDIDFPWPIAQLVYQHHERLDGSGYPRGLRGEDTLMGAKIIAVADTVEAMSSHRPYRAGLGITASLAEITKSRDKLYDAAVVDACVKLFREKRFAFSTSAQGPITVE
jgi:HD-GYP domain-containing protein (c-di-GMP phosphodiesterase class II)